jgi:hypothetical protein
MIPIDGQKKRLQSFPFDSSSFILVFLISLLCVISLSRRKIKMKKCPYCKIYFTPHVKVGSRQKTCGKPACKKALKAENNRRWRGKNSDYYKDDYPRVKQWLDDHPGYLKDYRESHPEYVQKNREAQRVRDRKKRLLLDIQAQLKRQAPEVTDQLCDLSNLDIQAQLSIKPLEMTFLFGTLPCLDIQV